MAGWVLSSDSHSAPLECHILHPQTSTWMQATANQVHRSFGVYSWSLVLMGRQTMSTSMARTVTAANSPTTTCHICWRWHRCGVLCATEIWWERSWWSWRESSMKRCPLTKVGGEQGQMDGTSRTRSWILHQVPTGLDIYPDIPCLPSTWPGEHSPPWTSPQFLYHTPHQCRCHSNEGDYCTLWIKCVRRVTAIFAVSLWCDTIASMFWTLHSKIWYSISILWSHFSYFIFSESTKTNKKSTVFGRTLMDQIGPATLFCPDGSVLIVKTKWLFMQSVSFVQAVNMDLLPSMPTNVFTYNFNDYEKSIDIYMNQLTSAQTNELCINTFWRQYSKFWLHWSMVFCHTKSIINYWHINKSHSKFSCK